MRAATYAKEIGRAVAFSLAAFRQAFAAGRDLTEPDNVLLAAAAAELHPRACWPRSSGIRSSGRSARRRSAQATLAFAASRACVVGDEVFWGDDRLEEAAAAAADRRRGDHALS